MKSPLFLSLALVSFGTAYPDILAHLNNVESNGKAVKRQAPGVTPPFDPSLQYVDTTGQYAFVAPGEGDQRGPCPGLNAMANHGYLPHNGVATISEFIEGTGKVFGMGVDLSTFLAIYGSVFDGDLTGWSIGGPTSLVSLGGLLGEPQGISGSHNKYEGDASPTRGDLYQYGNDYLVQLSQFQALYDLGKAADNYDLDLLTDYRATRFQESIDNNPYFFNAPFSGVAAQPAAWSFIYRFMANKSAEYPEGRLTGDVLKSFYSITGEDGDFTYTPGHERIPDNWYTRHPVDAYTIPYFSLDAVAQLVKYPEFGSIGGNTGTTNSFVGIDPSNLTSGVYSASNLAEGNNLLCYALELTTQETPDLLSGLFTDISAAQDQIGSALNNATNSLGCPQLNSINKDQFSQFPGYTQAYDGYTDPTSGGLL
ncbi:Cloroperoxidase [Viridothelium virens]|uniref:Cloroperoxidase n=1 Tax=Viridothelium virens TaxID=1048519 RepID=A0A6A6GT31_VIRVR|nr:Cloroperoxidase [Viridothelium virens]